jgi:hypothetical protein
MPVVFSLYVHQSSKYLYQRQASSREPDLDRTKGAHQHKEHHTNAENAEESKQKLKEVVIKEFRHYSIIFGHNKNRQDLSPAVFVFYFLEIAL